VTASRVLSERVERAAATLAVVAMAGLLLLGLVTTIDILMRYAFASPIRGFVDIASLAGAVLLAACMPHVLASRGNIAIDLLGHAMGQGWRRALDRFAALVSAGFFAVLAWQYVRFAQDMAQTGQSIPVLRWPVWPWWAAVAVCIVVAALVALATAWPVREEAT
jgi:TRAP-type C4-dicarboxylate transport system permease small subunit